mgnify:CR=1 FL=1
MKDATRLLSSVVATVAFLHPSPAPARQEAAFPEFKAHLVAQLPGGYKVAAVDINRDGRADIVGLATNPSCLAWYENPGWKKHVLDVTGDCRDEIVVWDPFELWVYTQHDSPRKGRLYKPARNPLYNYSNYQTTVSLPAWSAKP